MVVASREAVMQALDDLRGAIFELAPREAGSDDLAGGLGRYVDDFGAQWGLEVECVVEGIERPVDPEVVALMFAFVQESLTNVRKHAQTTSAKVRLVYDDAAIRVEVQDQGEGFDPAARDDEGFRKHQGLNLLRSRVWLMGGRIEVVSAPLQGTSLVMEISS
jgi:two-component system nitrate/nitrite sensor histidine kinase NarX